MGLRNNDEGKLLLNYISKYKIEGKEDIFNLNDVLLEIEVTGIMMHPEAVENSNFTSAFAYTDFEYMKDVFDRAIMENYYEQVNTFIEEIPLKELLVNQIIAKAENYSETVLEIDEFFSKKENNNLIINLTRDTLSSNISVQEDIVQARKMTYVFPTIFFIVSVLVILTTLSQMIVRERGQIGTMKAIGLSKTIIIYHYMNYGIALCLIGSILGVIVGPILLPEVMNIKYKLLWELPDIKPDLFHLEYIVCIALLLLLGALVSYLVCRSEVNLKPVESMRPVQIKEMKNIKTNKGVSIPTKMAIRNIFLNKARTMMVILGTMGCTALLVCGFGITDTLHYGVDKELYELFPYDIIVSYDLGKKSPVDEIRNIKGVKRVEELTQYPIKVLALTTKETTIRIIDGKSEIFKENYYSNGIAITKELADSLNLKINDKVKFILNGKEYERNIGTIFEACTSSGIFDISSNYEENYIKPNSSWILTENNPEEIKDEILKIDAISTANTANDVQKRANDLLSNIEIMTTTLKIFAILLAFVVIHNLATLNIKERSRSIATMKVLGFSRKEIANTLILEIMIMTFIGAIFGLFLGFPMVKLVLSINKTRLITFLYHVNPISYVYAFLLSAVVGLVINFVLSKKAYKIKMVEALKSVE